MQDGVIPPLDLGAVLDADLLEVLSVEWRRLSRQQARVWAVMAELATRDPMVGVFGGRVSAPGELHRLAVDEVRAELRLSRRAAAVEVDRAVAFATLPRVAQALEEGRLDRERAIVFAGGCWDLTPEQADTVLGELLPKAGECTATTLTQRVRRVATALDPAWAERRYRAAVRQRRMIGYLTEDGSATITAHGLSVPEAASACARVAAVADAAKRAGASATVDQLRADVFVGLLNGEFKNANQAQIVTHLVNAYPPANHAVLAAKIAPTMGGVGVHVRVEFATLLGLNEHPAELAGWGTITADDARDIVARQQRCEWRYAIHNRDGQLLFDGTTRHRPTGVAAGPAAEGGIVELLVPAALLTDDVAREHPDWVGLLSDLAKQYAAQQRPAQDPSARFPGRPLRRHTQIRFVHCIFPGCRRPATGSQVDHRRDHAKGGRTEPDQLAPLCPHDHANKTERGWRLIKVDEHHFRWISPLGRRHDVVIPPIAPPLPGAIPRPPPDPPF